jgi:Myb-like DNA-binding protein FlbD
MKEMNMMSQKISRKKAWKVISERLRLRSPKQCRERWEENLRPGLIKSPLTTEECDLILLQVKQTGRSWAHISRLLVGRSTNTVKNWWYSQETRRIKKEEKMRKDREKMAISSLIG